MTRGTAYILLPTKIVSSCEFNGDMYPGGYYEEMVNRLLKVDTEQSFYEEISEFDRNNFGYQFESDYFRMYEYKYEQFIDEEYDKALRIRLILDKAYYSDYSFIKNSTKSNKEFVDAEWNKYIVKPGEVITFYFSTYCNIHNEELLLEKKV